ncbi:MAG: hypothetical protein WKG07_45475 [Hymenobacter sp.]
MILKRVIKQIPVNYEQQDYATEVYAYRRLSNFDTLRYEAETVGRLRLPAGYRHFTGGFMALEAGPTLDVAQRHVLAEHGGAPLDIALYGGVQATNLAAADPCGPRRYSGRAT